MHSSFSPASLLTFLVVLLFSSAPASCHASAAATTQYIVQTQGDHQTTQDLITSQWDAVLSSTTIGRRLRKNGKKSPPTVVSQDVRISPQAGANDTYYYAEDAHRVALVELTDDEVDLLKQMPGVVDVLPNSPVTIASATKTAVKTAQPPQLVSINPVSWGLDRIDQSYGRDGTYVTKDTGKNVDVYIVDTGVDGTQPDLAGRVFPGTNILAPTGTVQPGNTDCHGHGTFCASIAAGLTYGVARGASIYPVKVMDCQGAGTVFSLISGIAWSRDMASLNWRNNVRRGVISMSLVCGANSMVDQAVQSAVGEGVTVVSAAGNYQTTACNYSPAREPSGITVGGTSWDDSILSFSNFGSCVTIFAPGDNIVGAWPNDGTNTLSGTSMATPHVAGAVALLYQADLSLSPDQIKQALLDAAVALSPPCDLDCAGLINPNIFLQVPTAAMRTIPAALPVPGAVLNNDFLYWLPELGIDDTKPVCVQFTAGVSAATGGATAAQAGISIALGTSWFPTIASYEQSAPTCMVPEYAYIFSGNPLATTIQTLGAGLVAQGAALSLAQPTSMYLIAQHLDTGGVYIEFGTGVVGDRSQTALVTFTDASRQQPQMSTLAFSTSAQFTLSVSGIANCGGGSGSFGVPGGDSQATSTPSAQPTLPALIPNAYTFFASSPTPFIFNAFNPTWQSSSTCFQFQAVGGGNALAALASQQQTFSAKVGPWTSQTAFVFTMGSGARKKTFSISKNGQVIKTVYAAPVKAANNVFQVRAAQGVVSLWRKTGTIWAQLLQVSDAQAGGVPFLSLSGVGRNTVKFQNMQQC